jgi:hypothetical protein
VTSPGARRTESIGSGRATASVRLTEVPIADRAPILRAFLEQVRGGRRFFGTSNPDAVAAAAAEYPVFRLDAT